MAIKTFTGINPFPVSIAFSFWSAVLWLLKKNEYCVDFLMHQNHMSLLLLIHNVIHPNDLNILLLVDVVLNNAALSKFLQQNFNEIL